MTDTEKVKVYQYHFDWYNGKKDRITTYSGLATMDYIMERMNIGVLKPNDVNMVDFRLVYKGCVDNSGKLDNNYGE